MADVCCFATLIFCSAQRPADKILLRSVCASFNKDLKKFRLGVSRTTTTTTLWKNSHTVAHTHTHTQSLTHTLTHTHSRYAKQMLPNKSYSLQADSGLPLTPAGRWGVTASLVWARPVTRFFPMCHYFDRHERGSNTTRGRVEYPSIRHWCRNFSISLNNAQLFLYFALKVRTNSCNLLPPTDHSAGSNAGPCRSHGGAKFKKHPPL